MQCHVCVRRREWRMQKDNAVMVKTSKSQTNRAEAKAKACAKQSLKRYFQGSASCASLLLMAAMQRTGCQSLLGALTVS
jgi:hypothetical protein